MNTSPFPSVPHYRKLVETAGKLKKGILAADEGVECLWDRFGPHSIPLTMENRVALREALFSTPDLESHLGGVILFKDTYEHRGRDGRLIVDLLKDKGILYGITVDEGMPELAGTHGEVVTQGIDGLLERCERFSALGATFAKFRAVIKLDATLGVPSQHAIQLNAVTLARYASIAQQAGLVPIVEPEVSVFEGTNDVHMSAKVTQEVLSSVFRALIVQNVLLEGIILKPNMVVAGKKCPGARATLDECAALTLRVLQSTVPPAVQGIAFLSGGLSETESTHILNSINQLPNRPWAVSFSFGRALQQSALQAWRGDPNNVGALQRAFLQRLAANVAASQGKLTTTTPPPK